MSDQEKMDTQSKYVPPAIDQTAFNCPHCGALTTQTWFTAHADTIKDKNTPVIYTQKEAEEFEVGDDDDEKNRKVKEWFKKWMTSIASERPFLERHNGQDRYYDLNNVSISKCYNCGEVAVWIYNRMMWPRTGKGPQANADLPREVRDDYEEASVILDLSPRGAAALLRLGIQKLCKHLGQSGGNINKDVGELVRLGLDLRVQQALDVVRVIGNNAVHPGQIDLRDDRATAEKLFGLVNLIAEIMISQPKHVKAMFDDLPPEALAAIQKRDAPKSK